MGVEFDEILKKIVGLEGGVIEILAKIEAIGRGIE